MTEQPTEPRHGEPGHVCHPDVIEAMPSIAGVIIRQDPEHDDAMLVETWSHGLTKRQAAHVLHQIANTWEEDAAVADLEAEVRRLN